MPLSCEEINGEKKRKKRKFNYIYVLCVIAEGKIKTHFFRDLTYPK